MTRIKIKECIHKRSTYENDYKHEVYINGEHKYYIYYLTKYSYGVNTRVMIDYKNYIMKKIIRISNIGKKKEKTTFIKNTLFQVAYLLCSA